MIINLEVVVAAWYLMTGQSAELTSCFIVSYCQRNWNAVSKWDLMLGHWFYCLWPFLCFYFPEWHDYACVRCFYFLSYNWTDGDNLHSYSNTESNWVVSIFEEEEFGQSVHLKKKYCWCLFMRSMPHIFYFQIIWRCWGLIKAKLLLVSLWMAANDRLPICTVILFHIPHLAVVLQVLEKYTCGTFKKYSFKGNTVSNRIAYFRTMWEREIFHILSFIFLT